MPGSQQSAYLISGESQETGPQRSSLQVTPSSPGVPGNLFQVTWGTKFWCWDLLGKPGS
jgi:hypothetical protein